MKSQTIHGTVVTIAEDNLRDFENNPHLGQNHVGHLCQALREAWAERDAADKVIEAARELHAECIGYERDSWLWEKWGCGEIEGAFVRALAEYDNE